MVRLPKIRTALIPRFGTYSHKQLRAAAARAPMEIPRLAGPFLVTHHGSGTRADFSMSCVCLLEPTAAIYRA